MSAPISPERVLPTLNADGTRNRIRPRLYEGPRHSARRIVAWLLMLLFVGLPLMKIGGKPALLLDVAERQFSVAGRTFLATDGVNLMLLLLTIFIGIIWLTALVGRAWCGWGCPQTVYMEFLFRPIERLFEGKREAQLRLDRQGADLRRVAKNVVFLALSIVLGNVFLAYFVGADRVLSWVTQSPSRHPAGFLLAAATSALVFFDFAYFREQMCTVACPYARIQSVLLDPRSLIVGYDARRGEPRSKGKARPGNGDCIDCQACVVSCPTGIDIRQGLQLECIACAQCADACDSIMSRIGKPLGLIRYASQATLASGKPVSTFRVRMAIYSTLLALAVGALIINLRQGQAADVTLLRGLGAPFTASGENVVNQLRLKVRNRTSEQQRYGVEIQNLPAARVIAPELPLPVAAGEQQETSFFVVLPADAFVHGRRALSLRVNDGKTFNQVVPYTLLGPESNKAR